MKLKKQKNYKIIAVVLFFLVLTIGITLSNIYFKTQVGFSQSADLIKMKPQDISLFGLNDLGNTERNDMNSQEMEPVDHNIKVISLSGSVTAIAGHIYDVTATIESGDENDLKDIPINFSLIDATINNNGKTRQYYSGMYTIPLLLKGVHNYNFRIIIPPISNIGTYKLFGLIYTTRIAGLSKGYIIDDNLKTQINNSLLNINLNRSFNTTANLKIWDFKMKDDVGIIIRQSADYLVFNGEITIVSLANNISNSTLKFILKSSDGGLIIPLKVLNSESNDYSNAINIKQLNSYIAQTVSVTLKVPSDKLADLKNYSQSMATIFTIQADINNQNENGFFSNDNNAYYPITVINDSMNRNIMSSCIETFIIADYLFDKIFGIDDLSAGISIHHNTALSGTKLTGMVNFKLPFTIFDASLNLIEVNAKLGIDFVNPETQSDPDTGLTISIDAIGRHISDKKIPLTKTWSTQLAGKTFGDEICHQYMIYCIPVFTRFSYEVSTTLNAFITYNGDGHKIGAGLRPEFNAGLSAFASVGIEDIGVGVEGVINLLHYDQTYAIYLDPIIYPKPGKTIDLSNPSDTIDHIDCNVMFDGTQTLNAGSGSIAILAYISGPYMECYDIPVVGGTVCYPWCCKDHEYEVKKWSWDPLWERSWKFFERRHHFTYTPGVGIGKQFSIDTINEDGTPCNPYPSASNSCIKCFIQ